MTDLLALTEELCAIPSVSREETAIADFVAAWLGDHAGSLGVDRVGDNIVVRTELGRDQRVVLGGHLDTVPPNGNAAPRRDGDTLHGVGTADMKGGLAVMLSLAEAFDAGALDTGALDTGERSPRFDVTWVFHSSAISSAT